MLADGAYFEQEVEPLLAEPHVEFIGEIGESDKPDSLGKAAALLFPADTGILIGFGEAPLR